MILILSTDRSVQRTEVTVTDIFSGLFTCLRLVGSATRNEVAFAIFGGCSNPGCIVEGVRNPVPSADSGTPTPMDVPTNPPSVVTSTPVSGADVPSSSQLILNHSLFQR